MTSKNKNEWSLDMKCAYCGADGAERVLKTGGEYSPLISICEKCWKERKERKGIWKNR